MGYVPNEARWYLADVVLEHRIEGDSRNVVHVNRHLVGAATPEQAYRKALALGRAAEAEYLNTEHKSVRVIFRGLRELNVIHEELEDGAELAYEELVGVAEEQLRRQIQPKRKLGVFAPRRVKAGVPNYMPLSVMRMLQAAAHQPKRRQRRR